MADADALKKPRRNVTFIAVAAGAILGGLLLLFSIIAGFNPFLHHILVTTYFADSLNLKTGAAVNLNGVTVGTVKRVDLTTAPERHKRPVQVTMKLDTRYLSGIHTDSLVDLTSLGALADTVVDIDSQHATGPQVADRAELPTLNTPTVLNMQATQDTMNTVHRLMGRLDTLVDQVESGEGTIGQLMSNENLTKEATATIGKVKQVSAKLDGRESSAGKALNEKSIGVKLADISSRMQGLQGQADKLSAGPLTANIKTTEAQTTALMADMNAGHGAVGMALHDAAFKQQLSGLAAGTKTLIDQLQHGDGTAGQLMAPQGDFQVNLKKLGEESSALAAKIRQNPKKSLTIELRLF